MNDSSRPTKNPILAPEAAWGPFLIVSALAIVLGVALILGNPDASHHDDDLTHYQMAAWSSTSPAYLLDSWGRPGFTALYALPAQAGWIGAKLFSLALAVATSLLTVLLARDLGLAKPWIAALLLWTQPLFFRLSTTTLTELPAAFYLTAALVLFFRNHFVWASLVFGMQFLTRHELVAFEPIWILALWFRRQSITRFFLSGVATLVPLALTNALSLAFGLTSPAAVFATAQTNLDYGTGTPLSYAAGSAVAFGALIAVLAVVGMFRIRAIRGLWLIAALAACYLAVHTILRTLNLFATGGYPRFLVTISPLIAILACAGWETPLSRKQWLAGLAASIAMIVGLWWETAAGILDLGGIPRNHFWWLYSAIFLQLVCTAAWIFGKKTMPRLPLLQLAVASLAIQWITQQWPTQNPGSPLAAKHATAWLRAEGLDHRDILTTNPWIKYDLGIVTPYHDDFHKHLEDSPPGSLLVWDANHGPGSSYRLPEQTILADDRFTEIHRFDEQTSDLPCRMIVFQKR